jgi:hypothetical protein
MSILWSKQYVYQHRMMILLWVLLAIVTPSAAAAGPTPDKPRSTEGRHHGAQTVPLQKDLSSAAGY